MKKTLFALAALALTTAASAQTTTAPATATPGATVTTGTDANQNARHGRLMGQDGHHGHKSPAQRADRHAAKMAKELGLTADQEAKVEGIFLAQNQEMTALKAKYAGNADRQAMRPEAKVLHDKYDGQLKAALGADAYARYDKMRDDRHDKMRAEHGAKDDKGKGKS